MFASFSLAVHGTTSQRRCTMKIRTSDGSPTLEVSLLLAELTLEQQLQFLRDWMDTSDSPPASGTLRCTVAEHLSSCFGRNTNNRSHGAG